MATTRLMPLHAGKGRTVAEALGRTTEYVKNPEKTNGGDLVTAYQCNPAIVDQEFLFVKRQYAAMTGRNQKEHDVIAYHLRQSFKPGEVTPELANKIGYDLAMSLTKGKHAFIVCTHVDKEHIHSHIVFNSTALDCTRKFRNFLGSPSQSEKSPTCCAGKTACRSSKIRSPAGAATALGWARNRPLSGNSWSE